MYQSPLHILPETGNEPFVYSDTSALLRLRKKLLAEFNLSPSPTISIGGKEYSKDEVIKTFDVLMGNPDMPLHLYVFSNKELLDFLERDESKVHPSQIRGLQVPEDVKPLLSPYLLERFAFNLRKAFHKKNFYSANELFVNAPLENEEDKAFYYDEVHRNLENLVERINQVRYGDVRDLPREFICLKREDVAIFLNNLPTEFEETVNSVVTCIINTLVAYQKLSNHDNNYLYCVSLVLCKVRCDQELMDLIQQNHVVFKNNFEGNEFTPDSGSPLKVGYYIIVFLIIVVRMATCNYNKPKYDYKVGLNTQDIFSSLSKTRSAEEEFADYRALISKQDTAIVSSVRFSALVEIDSNMSGRNPFKYLFESAWSKRSTDSGIVKVLVKNKSGRTLIITSLQDGKAGAAFFFNNVPDTLAFLSESRFCLYFGDSLSYYPELHIFSKTVYRSKSEVFFKHTDESALELAKKDFGFKFNNNEILKRAGRKQKKSRLPQLELDATFFEKKSVKTKQFTFGELLPRTTKEKARTFVQ